jgi:hypothetical protein
VIDSVREGWALAMHALGGVDLSVAAASAKPGFFGQWWLDMKALGDHGQYLSMLLDARVLVVMALVLLLGLVKHSRFLLLSVFAAYGLAATHRYAIGTTKTGEATMESLDNIVIFILGFGVIAGIVIYFTFVRGD